MNQRNTELPSSPPIAVDNLEPIFDRLAADSTDVPKGNLTRFRRALSWLAKAQSLQEQDDYDGAFLFFWISFNAMYSIRQSQTSNESETQLFKSFFDTLLRFDEQKAIYGMLWAHFSDSIRTLVENRYVFHRYWEHTLGVDDIDWETELDRSRVQVRAMLMNQDRADTILFIVFDRLYTLRNQLMHGSATYRSSVNRQSVRDGSFILHYLVPEFLNVMLQHPEYDWGDVMYPVIESNDSH